jgi:hypothetical protein
MCAKVLLIVGVWCGFVLCCVVLCCVVLCCVVLCCVVLCCVALFCFVLCVVLFVVCCVVFFCCVVLCRVILQLCLSFVFYGAYRHALSPKQGLVLYELGKKEEGKALCEEGLRLALKSYLAWDLMSRIHEVRKRRCSFLEVFLTVPLAIRGIVISQSASNA